MMVSESSLSRSKTLAFAEGRRHGRRLRSVGWTPAAFSGAVIVRQLRTESPETAKTEL